MAKAKTPRTAPTRTSPVLTMPEASSSRELSSSEGNSRDLKKTSTKISTDVNGEIRQRAYELYLERGSTPGHENEDWLVAEREVMARYNHQKSA